MRIFMGIYIEKKDFTEAIMDVMKASDYQNSLNTFFREHGADGYVFQPDCIASVIRLLNVALGTGDKEDLITRFCFDLDFGRRKKTGALTAEDGTDLSLSTPEELYDYLVCRN